MMNLNAFYVAFSAGCQKLIVNYFMSYTEIIQSVDVHSRFLIFFRSGTEIDNIFIQLRAN